jgi:hypothetical protein
MSEISFLVFKMASFSDHSALSNFYDAGNDDTQPKSISAATASHVHHINSVPTWFQLS